MKHKVAEARSKSETVESAPEEAACCAAEVGVRFVAKIVSDGVESEEERKRGKETVFGAEGILEEPSHGGESEKRAPEVAMVSALYAKPKKAPEESVDEERYGEE